MSSTPPLPSSAMIDTGPLSWVLGEIRESLSRSEQAIDAFCKADGMDSTQLRYAKTHLHQAHGALQVVDIDGVTLVTEEVEHLYELFETAPQLCNDAAVEAIRRGFQAVIEYLQDLLGGAAHQPVRLFPYYRALLAVRGADRVHPADLFFPDLSARPPKGAAPDQPLTVEQLGRARARFERGLLAYLRDPQDRAAIQALHAAVETIEKTQRAGGQRAFWWVTLAFLDALKADALPSDLNVKRLCARINLQMRRLLDGTATVAERLLKDTLFFVARSADASPRIAQVKQFYRLEGAIPQDFEESRYGIVDAQTLAVARERLEGAKAAWTRVVSGTANELKTFAVEAVGLRDTVSRMQSGELDRLTREIALIATTLQKSDQPVPEALGLEMATTLLMTELTLDNMRHLEDGFAQRVEVMLQRLQAVAEGKALSDDIPWLREMAEQAQQRLFMASVVHEIQASMTSVEKAMDTFFRDPAQKEDLPETLNILNQVAGALGLLGHADAVAAVRSIQQAAEEFVRSDYQPDQAQFDRVAQNCGALGFFAESLQQPLHAVTHTFAFDAATGEFSARLIEQGKPRLTADSADEVDAGFYGGREEPAELTGEIAPPKPFEPWNGQPESIDDGLAGQGSSLDGFATVSEAPALADDFTALAEATDAFAPLPELAEPAEISLTDLHRLSTSPAAPPLLDPARATPVSNFSSASPQMSDEEIDAELLEIFLGEAEEVLKAIAETLNSCEEYPENQELMTTIRRGFHTLKGSGRMVGLGAFGEAAWALEQTMNLWLAERRSGTAELFYMVHTALAELAKWVEEIRADGRSMRSPEPLIALAKQVRDAISEMHEPPVAASVDATGVAQAVPVEPEQAPAHSPLPEPEMAEPPAMEEAATLEFSAFEAALENPTQWAQQSMQALRDEVAALGGLDLPEADALPAIEPAAAPAALVPAPSVPDDSICIGTLIVSAPLYNIFLAEADDLVRRLVQDFSEWRHEPERPVSNLALRSSHSLTGSSATVGVQPINQISTLLEYLLHCMSRNPKPLLEMDFDLLEQSADVLRGMLHQFAAGQMPDTMPILCAKLEAMQMRFVPDANEPLPMLEESDEPALDAQQDPPVSVSTFADETDAGAAQSSVPISGGFRDDLDADLLPIFIEEAQDALPQIAANLREWEANPQDKAIPQQLLRYMHTVKGSARMAGAMRLGQVMHDMETRIEAAMALAALPPGLMEGLQTAHDQSLLLLDELIHPGAAPAALTPWPPVETVDAIETIEAGEALFAEAAPDVADEGGAVENPLTLSDAPAMPAPAIAAAAPLASPAATSAALVRVRADVLDRLLNQAGEVSIARSRIDTEISAMRTALSELTENMYRLRSQLREIEIQAEAQMSTRTDSDHLREFDPLEFDRFTRFQEITRMMAESVSDVGTVHQNLQRSLEGAEEDLLGQSRLTRELQQDLMRVRMVQFGSISERLYRVVRLAAKEMDKRVNLDIRGSQVELDRGVLEKMIGPFEHLLRNAVAHGIESREARRAAGKVEAGELLIEVRQEGNEVMIAFSDDGGGLNIPRIRERAESLGLLSSETDVAEQDIAEIIFEPGFSTATEVTETAGRGVGMDVVRSEAAALGGRIDLEFTPGAGTRFMIHLPLTLAITQVVLVRVGERQYAFPAVLVEQVQQLKPQALANAYNERGLVWQNNRIELHYLATLLGNKAQAPMAQRFSPVMILRSGIHRVSVHVDEIVGNHEAVVKNIGPQLARVPGIAGATVLGTGEIVMILNPVQLALSMAVEVRSHLALAAGSQQAEVMGAVAEILPPEDGGMPPSALVPADTETVPVSGLDIAPTIMVVDDSLTVRKVTQRLLLREGYQVVLAKDGVDALRQMQDYTPDVMLVDIEMPRMDGFDLTRNVRGDERFKHVPIIMITSRTADKHRNYALSLGVNEYMGKPFQETLLLQHIKHFISEQGQRASA